MFGSCHKKNLLLIAHVHRGKSYTLKAIFYNFVKEMLGKVGAVKEEKDERLLLAHEVFGRGREDENLWQPTPPSIARSPRHSQPPWCPPALSQGPTFVQLASIFEQMHTDRMSSPYCNAGKQRDEGSGHSGRFDYEALTSPRVHKSMGKKAPVAKKK